MTYRLNPTCICESLKYKYISEFVVVMGQKYLQRHVTTIRRSVYQGLDTVMSTTTLDNKRGTLNEA